MRGEGEDQKSLVLVWPHLQDYQNSSTGNKYSEHCLLYIYYYLAKCKELATMVDCMWSGYHFVSM